MNGIGEELKSRFCGKKVVLLGAGVSNAPLARFLSSYGASVEIRDKKSTEEMKQETVREFKEAGASFVFEPAPVWVSRRCSCRVFPGSDTANTDWIQYRPEPLFQTKPIFGCFRIFQAFLSILLTTTKAL